MRKFLQIDIIERKFDITEENRKEILAAFTRKQKLQFQAHNESCIMQRLAEITVNPGLVEPASASQSANKEKKKKKSPPKSFSEEWLQKLEAGGVDGLEVS